MNHRDLPPAPTGLPQPRGAGVSCFPNCSPMAESMAMHQQARMAPYCIPGTNIILDPCAPAIGRLEQWETVEKKVDLSEPVLVATPPQLFSSIAENNPNEPWTTVASYKVASGMHGLSCRYATTTNVPGFSDAVEFALFIGDEIFGDPWIGHKEWPTSDGGVPIARKAHQSEVIAIKARVTPTYWSANWPNTVTRRVPLRNNVAAKVFMEIYTVAVLEPCADDRS